MKGRYFLLGHSSVPSSLLRLILRVTGSFVAPLLPYLILLELLEHGRFTRKGESLSDIGFLDCRPFRSGLFLTHDLVKTIERLSWLELLVLKGGLARRRQILLC